MKKNNLIRIKKLKINRNQLNKKWWKLEDIKSKKNNLYFCKKT